MQVHYHSNMASIESESSLTDRYQTTIPEPVRNALGLHKRDKIRYEVVDGNRVVMTRVDEESFDPTVLAFLDFLERQIIDNPGSLVPLTRERLEYARELTKGVQVDINERLDPANE